MTACQKRAKPVPIYRDRDFYIPYFEIWLSGKRIDRELIHDIISVTYKDSLKAFDSFEIAINDWDAEQRTFKYSNRFVGAGRQLQYMFDPGQQIELSMGYFNDRQNLRRLLSGEITSLRPNFPSAGQPTLAISGLNALHRLRRGQVSQPYRQLTDSEIAKRIADRLKLEFEVDSQLSRTEQRHRYLLQYNEFDIVFLLDRARRIGYELFVAETTAKGKLGALRFRPSTGGKQQPYELEYGKSLIAFQPNLTTANQVGKVTVRGWDKVKKQPFSVTATRNQIATKGVGRQGGQESLEKSFMEREEIIVDQPIDSEEEARAFAKATLDNIAKDMLKGSGSVVGLPDLRAGSSVYLRGMGPRYDGCYFVTATTHTINDSGYITQFECRREETED